MEKFKRAFTLIELPVVRKRAFTLIELLIVIAIIGILATLIFVNVNTARKKARDAKRMADLKNLQTALEMYAQENGSYPTTGSAWVQSTSGDPNHYIVGVAPTYVGSLPVAPLNGTVGYYYAYNGNGTDYKLLACQFEINDPNNTFNNPVAPTNCYQVSSSETSRNWVK